MTDPYAHPPSGLSYAERQAKKEAQDEERLKGEEDE